MARGLGELAGDSCSARQRIRTIARIRSRPHTEATHYRLRGQVRQEFSRRGHR